MKKFLKKSSKKSICIVLSIVMLLIASCGSAFASTPVYTEYVKGDLNHDGHFNILDLTYMQRCLAGYEKPTYSTGEGDFNGSGRVDISDVTFGQKIIAGMEDFVTYPLPMAPSVKPDLGDNYYNKEYAEQFRELINDYREQNGLSRLEYREDIQTISDIRAEEIVKLFTYIRPSGKSCFTLYDDFGIDFNYVTESFLMGGTTPKTAFRYWSNYSSYVNKMLDPRITGISTSCYVVVTPNEIARYWVADYIG